MPGRRTTRTTTGTGLALAGLLAASHATAGDPRVPPGHDPGGTPVALLTTGIDYTRPEIAARLARDGEGEIIGWDVAGEDRLPFPSGGGDGDTALVLDLIAATAATPALSLLPVRIDPADPVSLAKALAFITRTPARTVLVPMWSSARDDWEPFRLAAEHYPSLRIVVPACAERPAVPDTAVYPRDLGLPNILTVAPPDGYPAAAWIGPVTRLPCLDDDAR